MKRNRYVSVAASWFFCYCCPKKNWVWNGNGIGFNTGEWKSEQWNKRNETNGVSELWVSLSLCMKCEREWAMPMPMRSSVCWRSEKYIAIKRIKSVGTKNSVRSHHCVLLFFFANSLLFQQKHFASFRSVLVEVLVICCCCCFAIVVCYFFLLLSFHTLLHPQNHRVYARLTIKLLARRSQFSFAVLRSFMLWLYKKIRTHCKMLCSVHVKDGTCNRFFFHTIFLLLVYAVIAGAVIVVVVFMLFVFYFLFR